MTEQLLRAIQQFDQLPIYDETDEAGCDKLFRCDDPRYTGECAEADDETCFWQFMKDPNLVVKGAIRYTSSDVRAVFWKLRT